MGRSDGHFAIQRGQVIALFVGALLGAALSQPSNASDCVAATQFGTAGNDYLEGSASRHDYIYGQDGNDQLFGYGCDDELHGNNGRDETRGAYGNDLLYLGDGHDNTRALEAWGGAIGGEGNDTMWGGNGNDDLGFNCYSSCLSDTDNMHGEADADFIEAEDGDTNDGLFAGSGTQDKCWRDNNEYMIDCEEEV